MDESCGTCRFFKEYPEQGTVYGWCRRYPPTPSDDLAAMPLVDSREWCGEFDKRVAP